MLLHSFSFCPFCGSEVKKEVEFSEIVDWSFHNMEKSVEKDALQRIRTMEEKLSMLESDLDKFIDDKIIASQG